MKLGVILWESHGETDLADVGEGVDEGLLSIRSSLLGYRREKKMPRMFSTLVYISLAYFFTVLCIPL